MLYGKVYCNCTILQLIRVTSKLSVIALSFINMITESYYTVYIETTENLQIELLDLINMFVV